MAAPRQNKFSMPFRAFFALVRPEHWVKNLFLFIPAFFAARLADPAVLKNTLTGFVAFCCMSSAVYALNDIVDAAEDARHPVKSGRPIPTGAIGKKQAALVAALFFMTAAGIALLLPYKLLIYIFLYFAMNCLYSFSLKHVALLDVSLIGMGFLLRVYAGGATAGVEVSQWLTVLTFLLALILGFSKRRTEFAANAGGRGFRKALESYNLPFLDAGIVVCSTVAIVAYLMYCFSPEVTERIGSLHIYYTAFFVILGILRYLQLTFVYCKTESPTAVLLNDFFLQAVLLGWIGCFVWLLYLKKN
jgi:decaprenyl-phosphate phosphoribosyltransferase